MFIRLRWFCWIAVCIEAFRSCLWMCAVFRWRRERVWQQSANSGHRSQVTPPSSTARVVFKGHCDHLQPQNLPSGITLSSYCCIPPSSVHFRDVSVEMQTIITNSFQVDRLKGFVQTWITHSTFISLHISSIDRTIKYKWLFWDRKKMFSMIQSC